MRPTYLRAAAKIVKIKLFNGTWQPDRHTVQKKQQTKKVPNLAMQQSWALFIFLY